MRLHQTAMMFMVVGVFSLMVAPTASYAQRGGSNNERNYTVEGISCTLFPEDCTPSGNTRGLPQRPAQERPARPSAAAESVVFNIRFATNSDTIPSSY